jgi:glycosyltransferase involved in cell wall biosynthesis
MRALIVVGEEIVSDSGGGGSKRTSNLVRGFEREGISTTMISFPSGDPDPRRRGPGDLVPAHRFAGRRRKTYMDKLRALVSPLPQDVWARPGPTVPPEAILSGQDVCVFMAPHATRILPFVRRAGVPVVVDLRDERSQVMRRIAPTIPGRVARWRTRLDGHKWRRYERQQFKDVSLIVVASEDEADLVRSLLPATRVEVRPNGVDVSDYAFVDHSVSQGARILLTGHFGYPPNIDAARWLKTDIFPALRAARPDATLELVGRYAPAGPWPEGMASHADVPDILPYFDAADVMIVPLRAGGGTRLKIVEAFAKGLPTVSTRIGCEGLPARDGEHLLIADSADALVAATLRLLDDVSLRAALAANARRLVEDQFDWRQITARYATDLRALVRG